MRLLHGLGMPPAGRSNLPGQGGPPPLLTRGLGGVRPQTARPECFLTPMASYHVPDQQPADPGYVPVDYDGLLLLPVAPDGTASPNPFLNGRPLLSPTVVLDGDSRRELDGTIQYAVINPVPHDTYNGRSLQLLLPADLFPSPRSLERLEHALRAQKGETAYTLVRRGDGTVLATIEDLAEEA